VTEDDTTTEAGRRDFLKGVLLGSAALTGAAAGLMGEFDLQRGIGISAARAQGTRYKMAFIQWQPHTVPAAWSKGIEEVLKPQQVIDYELLDGQNKVEVQASLMDTLINQGASVIFLQPIDSVALAPSIAKAKRAGISVITLNIDATEAHASHVEMNHYYGAMDIAKAMGDAMGGKGKVAILNAPPGIIIRDQRTNGFVDGMKAHHPAIEIVADQVADWDRKKAQDVLNTILAAHPDLGGAYGVNDSMALGAVDVAKEKGLIGKFVVFGNDGETAALESIEAGELTGTQYTATCISRDAWPPRQRPYWRRAACRRRRSPSRATC
jgi:ribose transport system substrate-binding protein